MNETELLLAFKKERSEEAFAELVRRYAGLVYSVAQRRLANAALAEDVTQIVFIKLAKTPPQVASHGELVAWLHRTATNASIDTLRSEMRRRAREQQALAMETSTDTVWESVAPKLDQALNELNDGDRQTLLLRFFAGKSMRDLGAVLGVSEDAAKMRVSRAVDRLRSRLGVGSACTVAVLDALLIEHSVQAAPSQLISRLAATRLPALNGGGGGAGMFPRIFAIKTTVVVLAIMGVAALYLLRSRTTSIPQVTQQSSTTNGLLAENANRARRDLPGFNAPSPTKAVKILLHVLDAETGAGLANSKIHVAFFGPGGEGESHDILTDKDGEAPIAEPDDSTKVSGPNVFVTAEGHVPKVVGFRSGEVPGDYTIKLDPAMTIGGLVVDEQGVPLSGVVIRVRGPGSNPGQAENVDFQTSPVTNREDGSWSCSYIPKDYTNEIRLILEKPGFAMTTPVVPVAQVDLRNLVLVISRGFAITGRVTDRQGNPVADADITTLDGDQNKRQSAKTDEQGYFTLLGVSGDSAPGMLSQLPSLATNDAGGVILRGIAGQGVQHANLGVVANGFASQTVNVDLLDPTNAANVSLAQGNVFRGQVVDEAGNPISNAVVRTDYDFKNQAESPFKWNAHTDANGRFEWNSAPGQQLCYWFEAPGFKVIRGLPLLADGSDHQITLQGSVEK